MNDVTLSGIISGSFQEYGNDGILFKAVVSAGSNNSDEFTCLAFSNNASFIKHKGKSGQRIVFQGRLGSDKLGTENYHSALTVGRVLAITDSDNGTDSASIVVTGESEVQDIRYVGQKETPLVPIKMTNLRSFRGRDGQTNTYKTFIGASAWSDRAVALNASSPEGVYPLVVSGFLRSRNYENQDGDTIEKIDVWVQEVLQGEGLFGDEDSSPAETAKPEKSSKTEKKEPRRAAVDDAPF